MGTATATPETLCEEGGRSWAVLDGDEVVATTRGRCLGKEARGWHFVTQLTMAGAATPLHEMHLWLGRDGTPRHAQLREPSRVTRYRWADGGLEITLYGDLRRLEIPENEVVWVTPRHALFLRELMFRLGVGVRDAGTLQLGFVPSRDAVVPLPLRLDLADDTVTATAEQGSFFLALGASRAWDSARLREGRAADGTLIYREQDGPGSWDPALPEIPLPSYAVPDDLMTVPVKLDGEGSQPTLAGELVARKDADTGPHCGVVFLSGSGSQERHGFVPGSSIDIGSHEIQDALARAGCIVLRFDDRGTGDSELGPSDAGYQDLVQDARRAIRVLGARPEVDPKRVYVIGHSEGALTAVLLAGEKHRLGKRKERLAGVVLMGLVGRNLREVIYSQVRTVMAGKPASEVEAEVEKARALHDRLMAGETPAQLAPVANWMRQIFAIDPATEFSGVRIPVLLLQGDKDFQVDPELDYAPLAKQLEADAKIRGAAHLLPGLDHLFKPEPGKSSVGHYADLSRRVDPDAIALIVNWITGSGDDTG